MFCFFNDKATNEIYTRSIHDALPIQLNPPTANPPDRKLVLQTANTKHRQQVLKTANSRHRKLVLQTTNTTDSQTPDRQLGPLTDS